MDIKIWAHRGASGYAPENTLEAFQLAEAMKADGVELDVQMTRDGQLVVAHDETIDRVSNGSGYIKDMTFFQLRQFDFNKTHPEYEHAKIPLLEDVLFLLRSSDMIINIELKTGLFFYTGIEERVLELTKHMGLNERIWYSSFNHGTLDRIRRKNPAAQIGVLYSDGLYNPVEYAKNIGASALHPAIYNLRCPELKEKCCIQKMQLHPWTVNTKKDMSLCVKVGAQAVITNYPDRAREWAESINKGEAG